MLTSLDRLDREVSSFIDLEERGIIDGSRGVGKSRWRVVKRRRDERIHF
jgi:hypothetical protein